MPFGHGGSVGGLGSAWFGLGGAYLAEEGAIGRPSGPMLPRSAAVRGGQQHVDTLVVSKMHSDGRGGVLSYSISRAPGDCPHLPDA